MNELIKICAAHEPSYATSSALRIMVGRHMALSQFKHITELMLLKRKVWCAGEEAAGAGPKAQGAGYTGAI